MRILWILRRATLPIETVALAILIMGKLSNEIYNQLQEQLRFRSTGATAGSELPEIVVIGCLMIAQKILHDSPYTTATWSNIGRPPKIVCVDILTGQ